MYKNLLKSKFFMIKYLYGNLISLFLNDYFFFFMIFAKMMIFFEFFYYFFQKPLLMDFVLEKFLLYDFFLYFIIIYFKMYNFLNYFFFMGYISVLCFYLILKYFFSIFFSMFIIFFIVMLNMNTYNMQKLKYYSIIFSNVLFFLFFLLYNFSFNEFFSYFYLYNFFYLDLFDLNFIFGMDNFSILFIMLTCFLFNIAFLVSLNNMKYEFKLFIFNFFLLEFLMMLSFCVMNLFLFYILFELSLMPMFLLIGIWGSSQRKIYAVYQFFYYTLLGSIFLFFSMFILYSHFYTLDMQILMNSFISYESQLLLWMFLFFGFSTKIPLMPFHSWLPEAHVEAPTSGSVILAGILLKLGAYGLLRFLLPLCFFANYYYLFMVYSLCLFSIFYISFVILIQLDLKKMIAYSSILHMNFIILGLFSFNLNGMMGSIFLMFSHALMSSGLFMSMGVLYDRYKTRNLIYYGKLTDFMPIFSIFFFLLILSNMSFPLTSNFIGELLLCLGLVENNLILLYLIVLSTFFNTLYSMWFFNRMFFGKNSNLNDVSDVSEKEFFMLFYMIILIFLLGMKPNLLIDFIQNYVYWLLEYLNY